MLHIAPPAAPSPLIVCDHLISLAQEADRAGLTATARHLVGLVDSLFDDGKTRRPRRSRRTVT